MGTIASKRPESASRATAAGSSNEPATPKRSTVIPASLAVRSAPAASTSVISRFQRATTIATFALWATLAAAVFGRLFTS